MTEMTERLRMVLSKNWLHRENFRSFRGTLKTYYVKIIKVPRK